MPSPRHSLAAASVGICLAALLSLGCEPAATTPPDIDAGVRVDAGPRPDAGPRIRDSGPDAPRTYDAGPAPRMPEATLAAEREACAFDRGAMPWETIGEEFPIGDDIPIRHFILIMQENRSFDHYFGAMPGVDGIVPAHSNPDGSGTPVAPFHTDVYCVDDPHHGWSASHRQWNDGDNLGFVTNNGPDGERAMGYLTGEDLPFYWDLYSTFAMSDHHHCSLLGPTWPNRMYYYAATSHGLTHNDAPPRERYDSTATDDHLLPRQLDRIGVSWAIYHTTVPFAWGAYPSWALQPEAASHMRRLSEFYDDLAAGTLPEVSWVDPSWALGGTQTTDEHPPANPQIGQAWLRDVVTRLLSSPHWHDTALIVTYDEHGGFWDHAPPPAACPPGDHPADSGDGYEFDRLGFRVPLVVVSPYARAAYVSDRVTDHTSIVRLVQARYLLPALTARDANAWPMLDMFDFASPPFATPPPASDLAEAPVDDAANAICRARSTG